MKTEPKHPFSSFSLVGKTALVTGAAGLLGIAHARALIAIGAKVVLTDVNHDQLLKTKSNLSTEQGGNEIEIFVMDVTSEESIESTFQRIKDIGLRIDILINNAAINPTASSLVGNVRTTRLENFSLDRWNMEVSVGLTGAYLCSKIFGTAMAEDGIGGDS